MLKPESLSMNMWYETTINPQDRENANGTIFRSREGAESETEAKFTQIPRQTNAKFMIEFRLAHAVLGESLTLTPHYPVMDQLASLQTHWMGERSTIYG